MTGRPTLRDVAAAAGVSLKTASRALNGEAGVAPATAERVADSARRLGFRLNLVARSLRSGRPSSAVGMTVTTVADPFFSQVVGAVETVLAERGLLVIIASHEEDADRQRSIIRNFVDRRVGGLLVVPAPDDASYLQPELDHGLVVVALDRPLAGVAVDTVTVDNRGAAADVVQRFVADGHRRIGVLCHDLRPWTMSERLAGYELGLAAAGLQRDESLVFREGAAPAAQRAVSRMFELADPPTAIFAAHNDLGRAVIREARAAGRRVALAVFDEVTDPDLLVQVPDIVESDPVRLGRVAAGLLLERLDGYGGGPRDVVLPVRVITAERVDSVLGQPA